MVAASITTRLTNENRVHSGHRGNSYSGHMADTLSTANGSGPGSTPSCLVNPRTQITLQETDEPRQRLPLLPLNWPANTVRKLILLAPNGAVAKPLAPCVVVNDRRQAEQTRVSLAAYSSKTRSGSQIRARTARNHRSRRSSCRDTLDQRPQEERATLPWHFEHVRLRE